MAIGIAYRNMSTCPIHAKIVAFSRVAIQPVLGDSLFCTRLFNMSRRSKQGAAPCFITRRAAEMGDININIDIR